MDALIIPLRNIVDAMPGFGILFLFLLFNKLFFRITARYNINQELTEKDNAAFGICLGGYLTGAGIALSGALFGTGASLVDDVLTVLVGGVAVVVLMRLSVFVNDLFILSRFKIQKEIVQDKNMGTGFVVAGGCIATGLILNGVLTGESDSFWMGIRDIAVYWLLGQLVLVAGGVVFQLITSYDVHTTIGEDDNTAAGIGFGAFLLSTGVIIRASLAGASSSLLDEVLTAVVIAFAGIVLLVCVRVIADKVFLPGASLAKEVVKDKNSASAVIVAASYICAAVLLASAVRLHPEEKAYPGVEGSVESVQQEQEQDEGGTGSTGSTGQSAEEQDSGKE